MSECLIPYFQSTFVVSYDTVSNLNYIAKESGGCAYTLLLLQWQLETMSYSHNATTAEALLPSPMNSTLATPVSYFSYAHYPSLLLAHIVLMTLAWFFILPIGMLAPSSPH